MNKNAFDTVDGNACARTRNTCESDSMREIYSLIELGTRGCLLDLESKVVIASGSIEFSTYVAVVQLTESL